MIDAIKRLRNRDGSPTKSRVANKERAGFFLYQSLNWMLMAASPPAMASEKLGNLH